MAKFPVRMGAGCIDDALELVIAFFLYPCVMDRTVGILLASKIFESKYK